MGFGKDFAALAEIPEVQEDGAAEVLLGFTAGVAVRDAAWEVE